MFSRNHDKTNHPFLSCGKRCVSELSTFKNKDLQPRNSSVWAKIIFFCLSTQTKVPINVLPSVILMRDLKFKYELSCLMFFESATICCVIEKSEVKNYFTLFFFQRAVDRGPCEPIIVATFPSLLFSSTLKLELVIISYMFVKYFMRVYHPHVPWLELEQSTIRAI